MFPVVDCSCGFKTIQALPVVLELAKKLPLDEIHGRVYYGHGRYTAQNVKRQQSPTQEHESVFNCYGGGCRGGGPRKGPVKEPRRMKYKLITEEYADNQVACDIFRPHLKAMKTI